MRRFLVAFVVSAAVATATILDDDFNSYDEEQNNVGIFMPRSLNQGSMDRAVRAFYYNYWLYPSMALKNRVPYEVSPYTEYNYVEPLTFQDVFEKPVFVVTPSQNAQNTFSVFYLHNGLRTLHRYHTFSWLQEFFKHPGLKGLIFYPHLIYNVRFFETPVSSVTLQDDMRMSDFVTIENCNSGKIPYMFVAPEALFDRMHFENIAKVSDFKVYGDAIEVQPIIALPRPVYEPFYGTQSSQQHQLAQQVSGAAHSGSSVNTVDFPSNEDNIERPAVVAQSAKSGASHIGRGVYGDEGYGLEGQYAYGKNQGYVGNEYGPSDLLRVDGSHYANAASSNLYNQGAIISSEMEGRTGAQIDAVYGASGDVYGEQSGIKSVAQSAITSAAGAQMGGRTGAQVDAAYGASRDLYGAQSGISSVVKSATISTPGAQLGVAQNSGQLKAGGEVKYHGTSKGSGSLNYATETGNQGSQLDVSRIELNRVGGQISGQTEGASRVDTNGVQSIGGSLSRVESGSDSNQLVGSQTTGLSGAQTIEALTVSGQKSGQAEGVSRIDGVQSMGGGLSRVESGSKTNQIVGPQNSRLSGAETIEVVKVSRTEAVPQASGRSAIHFPKAGEIEGLSVVGLQGDSGVQGGSVSRTESVKLETQGGVQGGLVGGLNAGSISRGNTGGIEQVTQTYTVSGSEPAGDLFRTGGNLGVQGGLGGNVGLQGGIGGKFGLQGEIGQGHGVLGGLMKTGGSGVTKIVKTTVDTTTHGLGDILGRNEGHLKQPLQSGIISSNSVVTKSVSSSNVESSTIGEPRITGTRSLFDDSTPASPA